MLALICSKWVIRTPALCSLVKCVWIVFLWINRSVPVEQAEAASSYFSAYSQFGYFPESRQGSAAPSNSGVQYIKGHQPFLQVCSLPNWELTPLFNNVPFASGPWCKIQLKPAWNDQLPDVQNIAWAGTGLVSQIPAVSKPSLSFFFFSQLSPRNQSCIKDEIVPLTETLPGQCQVQSLKVNFIFIYEAPIELTAAVAFSRVGIWLFKHVHALKPSVLKTSIQINNTVIYYTRLPSVHPRVLL